MSADQTLEIFRVLNKYFKNEEDATRIVSDIQRIIDNKFEEKKDVLATKEDIMRLERITKEDILHLENKLENKINDTLKWTMATIIAVGGLIVALIKLL